MAKSNPAPKAYVFGGMIPTSGPAAFIGKLISAAMEIAADDINAKGGIDGVPIKLVYGNHEGKAEMGVKALRKIIEVNKILMTLASWSTVITASAPICDQYKVMQFNNGGTSPFLLNLGPYTWSVLSSTMDEDKLLIRYLIKEMGLKRIAIIYNNNMLGKAHLKVFQELVPKYGGTFVGDLPAEGNQMDFASEVSKARRWKPDFIFMTLSGNGYAFIRQAHTGGLKDVPIGLYSSNVGTKPVQEAITATNMTAYASTADISTERHPELAKFQTEYKKRTGARIAGAAMMNAYDIVYIMAKIIKLSKAKGGDYLRGERLREALVEQKTFAGGLGIPTTFDTKTGGCSKPMSVVKCFRDSKTGQFTVKELSYWTTDQVRKMRGE